MDSKATRSLKADAEMMQTLLRVSLEPITGKIEALEQKIGNVEGPAGYEEGR